jgi:hypothetical protein
MDVCFLGGTGVDHIWFNTAVSEKISVQWKQCLLQKKTLEIPKKPLTILKHQLLNGCLFYGYYR